MQADRRVELNTPSRELNTQKMWNHSIAAALSAICLILALSDAASLPRKQKQKVCVIGAGPAGLISAKLFADNSDLFDVVVFDKNAEIGGTWLYTERTDVDEHGLPVTSAMYRDLRTNVPKELMAYPDYLDFAGENRSCVHHETVLDYLKNHTDHFGLRKYMQLNTLVENVKTIPGRGGNWRTTKHLVRTKNLNTDRVSRTLCNAVVVGNGHYSTPKVPVIPGMRNFAGDVMHSLTYRVPEVYEGKTVLVLGASSSGIDISIEISQYAKKVYLSHNHARIQSPLPSNVVQIAGVIKVNGYGELILKDGSIVSDVDAFIFCTGYLFSYPFLKEGSGIAVRNNYVSPLYKNTLHVEHPSVGFVGLPLNALAFATAYVQAKYFVALLKGEVVLPDKETMIRASQLNGIAPRLFHNLGDAQWAYHDELAEAGNFEPLPKFYREGYTKWVAHKEADYVNFRDSNFIVLDNGDVEIVHPKRNV